MEKFYIAEEGSRLRKDYLKHLESDKKVRELIVDFFNIHGITTNKYYANDNYLHIVPTEGDKQRFVNQLCKPKDGLYKFRVNSKINKAWVKTLKQFGVKVLSRPRVPFYFDKSYGRSSSRMFEFDGVVYCSLRSEVECKPIDILKEIKGSEFYKVVDDYYEKLKQKEV